MNFRTRFYIVSILSVVLAHAFMVSTAFAGDHLKGIAFVQAPEQSTGVCLNEEPDKAFDCAIAECVSGGASADDCIKMRWCFPSGWAADIFKQHKEGLHWHDYLCGWNSEADLDAAVKVACEGSAKEYLSECSVVAKWNPDGQKTSE